MNKILVGILGLLLSSGLAVAKQFGEEDPIPSPMKERAKYYLISVEDDGQYLSTVPRRTSSWGTGFAVARIDCAKKVNGPRLRRRFAVKCEVARRN